MSFQTSRNQFKIAILSDSINSAETGPEIKTTLASSGYETFLYFDSDALIKNLGTLSPHFLIFDISALSETLNDFFTSVLNAAPDVRLVAISNATDSEALMSYREYGLAAHIPSGENIVSRTCWEMDTLAQSLYSELTIAKLIELQSVSAQDPFPKSTSYPLKELLTAKTQEEIINVLFNYFNSTDQVVVFRKIPAVGSYLPIQMKGVSETSFKDQVIESPDQAKSILIQQNWNQVEVFDFFYGFIATNISLTEESILFVRLVSQMLKKLELQLETERLDIHDSATGFLRADQLDKVLVQESERAKRLKLPLCMMYLKLEGHSEILEKVGAPGRDIILKTIYQLIYKSSRVNDSAFRISDDQMILALVHTPLKGALIRAERLRRLVDTHPFGIMGVKVVVSIGVSEYPTLCGSMADLIDTSKSAMQISSRHNGNKICVYQSSPNYQPPFLVDVEN